MLLSSHGSPIFSVQLCWVVIKVLYIRFWNHHSWNLSKLKTVLWWTDIWTFRCTWKLYTFWEIWTEENGLSSLGGHWYSSIARVAKCHRYGRYICVKYWKVGVKSVGEHVVLPNYITCLGKFKQLMWKPLECSCPCLYLWLAAQSVN